MNLLCYQFYTLLLLNENKIRKIDIALWRMFIHELLFWQAWAQDIFRLTQDEYFQDHGFLLNSDYKMYDLHLNWFLVSMPFSFLKPLNLRRHNKLETVLIPSLSLVLNYCHCLACVSCVVALCWHSLSQPQLYCRFQLQCCSPLLE